jgi:hypothetical protein
MYPRPRYKLKIIYPGTNKKSDVGKIILKGISDQIKIIFSKNDFKSDQDHIFFKNDLDLKSRSKIIFCSQSPLFERKNFKYLEQKVDFELLKLPIYQNNLYMGAILRREQ